jgi:hypothetical protein
MIPILVVGFSATVSTPGFGPAGRNIQIQPDLFWYI